MKEAVRKKFMVEVNLIQENLNMQTNLQKHLAYFNSDKELSFDEPSHRYYDENDKTFLSVTQFLGQYEDPFDEYFWGMYTALKNNGKKVKPKPEDNAIVVDGKLVKVKHLHEDNIYKHWYAETIAKWKGINAEACHRGNMVHNFLEDSINQSKGVTTAVSDNHNIMPKGYRKDAIETVNDLDLTDLQGQYPMVYDRLKQYIERDCIIYAEKRVKLDFAQLAGTIDVPIIKRDSNRFCILDWKTNKDEFKPTSGYMKKIQVGGQWIKSDIFVPTDDKFKYPVNHLPACKLYAYSLQLSLYAYIMEVWGYELVDKGLEIIHIRPGAEPKLIKIPYLKDEIELLIKHRLEYLGVPFFDAAAYMPK